MADVPVQLLDHKAYINNFLQQDELKESHLYLMENLNFIPDENSYVEPFVDVAEIEALKRKDANEETNEDPSMSDPKAKDKKMSAADKKKAEEAKAGLEDSISSDDKRK